MGEDEGTGAYLDIGTALTAPRAYRNLFPAFLKVNENGNNVYEYGGGIHGHWLYEENTNSTIPNEFSIEGSTTFYSVRIITTTISDGIYYCWLYRPQIGVYEPFENRLFTNNFQSDNTATIVYTIGSAGAVTSIPQVTYSDTELYLAFDNLLQITANLHEDINTLFNLPAINNQSFIDNITAMKNISTTDVAVFFGNKIVICSKVEDTNLGFRYDYYNTKLSTGVRLGDSVINTLEGSLTIFPTLRGLASMNYQAFMATNDQVLQYITDDIRDLWISFFNDSINNGNQIKIIQWRTWLVLTNGTKTILLFDLVNICWWKWTVPINVITAFSDQVDLKLIKDTLLIFKDATQYYDFSEIGNFKTINWLIKSQPLHMKAPNHYKNLKQLIFQFADTQNTQITKTMLAQIKLYRKKITVREPETVAFKIEELRTFVKRFNYWKINEVQWGLANDIETNTPTRFELDGITIKYEIGEEVR